MTRLQLARTKVVGLAVVAGLVVVSIFASAPSASAAAPPAGYGGPVNSCGGTFVGSSYLYDNGGAGSRTLGSQLHIWYSTAGGGTYCAMTFDNLSGSHHMEVQLRRQGWTTPWQDSGTYSTFAGGIQHFGSNGNCVFFFGRVTVNGVNYETKFGLRAPAHSYCWLP
jgi:hypothetical protein